MDEGSWSLLALYAVLVLVGGIVGGALPLMLKNLINSDKIINLISIFGAGIMLGVGLIVIVPEGTSLVYGSFPQKQNAQVLIGIAITGGFILMLIIDEIIASITHHKEKTNDIKFWKKRRFSDDLKRPLIDQKDRPPQDLNHFVELKDLQSNEPAQLGTHTPKFIHSRKNEKRIVAVQITTLGLGIHCLSDGLALGISEICRYGSQLADVKTGALVFLAVVLHKIPALFGYSVFLIHQSYNLCKISALVLLISAISPVISVIGYAITVAFLDEASPQDKDRISGALLVISAGTFLYAVTMHILPEVYVRKNDAHTKETVKSDANERYPKVLEMCALFVGILFPLLLKFI